MTVLSNQQIEDLIDVDNLFDNYDKTCIGPASYELRIGSALSLSDNKSYKIDLGVEFAIKPNSHLLLGTIEKIRMPKNIVGTMFLKSKFGRGGFIPWGQGLVDPGYEGNLTVSLINFSLHPRIFVGGEKLCHIIFQRLDHDTNKPYNGVYKGSAGATGPQERPMLVLGDALNAGISGLVSGLAQGMVS